MNQAVIDIGSNSMRLTAYETNGQSFKTLFKEKIMAGLAGYVENGYLNSDGIQCACNGLLEFKSMLEALGIKNAVAFATASLRNIKNTDEAVAAVEAATGFPVEVITGEREAIYGYVGAMHDLSMLKGVFVDIGGASTEIAVFDDGVVQRASSFCIGSLKLYRECVKNILPGKGSIERMHKTIRAAFAKAEFPKAKLQMPLACVGGTARAVLKLAAKVFALPDSCRSVTAKQLQTLCDMLCAADKTATDLILKLAPERIHTMIPGILILKYIVEQFGAPEIVISKYGVREGYLCQKILNKKSTTIPTPKTGN